MINRLKRAFTLGEILLVVGIIGITAALAIPNIKNSFFNEEQKYINLLRTTIPQIQAAEQKAIVEYGDKNFDLKHVSKYLQVAHVCSSPTDGCLANSPIYTYGKPGNNYSGTSHLNEDCFYYGVVLANGVSLVQNNRTDNSRVYLDLDNIKGPSTYRLDLFELCNINLTQLFSNYVLDYSGISWPIIIGNMDYLRCEGDLSWDGKHTCE